MGKSGTRAGVFEGADWSAEHPIPAPVNLAAVLATFDRVAGELDAGDARRLRQLIEIGAAAVNLHKTEAAYGAKRELIMESAREQLTALHLALRAFKAR